MTGQREQLCERSDLPPSMCAHCRGLGWEPVIDLAAALDDEPRRGEYLPRDNAMNTMPGFKAEFTSSCPGCNDEIKPGDRIARERDGRRRWVCGPCFDSDEVLS